MDENEYLLLHLIRDRVREAEKRGALQSLLRDTLARDVRPAWWWPRLARPFASQAERSVLG